MALRELGKVLEISGQESMFDCPAGRTICVRLMYDGPETGNTLHDSNDSRNAHVASFRLPASGSEAWSLATEPASTQTEFARELAAFSPSQASRITRHRMERDGGYDEWMLFLKRY